MPIFISYSHENQDKVEKIAAHLVKDRANIWIDEWELNVGDSILNKIQEAIETSAALLIVLSKASVKSEWCKKELTAGLMRELSEKEVIVLPVLIEDCEIPLFLKDKKYADFRTDFDTGLNEILGSIAKIVNSNQGRLLEHDGYGDWACDWKYIDDLFYLRYTIVFCSQRMPLTFITEIQIFCNDIATKRYEQYSAAGLGWIGRSVFAELLFDIGEKKDIRWFLDSQLPKEMTIKSDDDKTGLGLEIIISSRKLGEDNGKSQLIDISDYLKGIREYIHGVSRQPTRKEYEKMIQIQSMPWPN